MSATAEALLEQFRKLPPVEQQEILQITTSRSASSVLALGRHAADTA
ncbi:MAG TPA: hypothetical protein PKI20_04335 [Verrucomicrobiota bacterium]|jgi:hypothetical protein|nr:hypothetical protein [Verrucomicrobiota bacterium]HQL76904.1 hypothetical protein [Verrucomicrobiota bacterium]